MNLKLFSLLLLSLSTLVACASSGPGSQLPDSHAGLDPRLTALWQERNAEPARGDFPIGPGDVLEIAVPDLPEIEARSVRGRRPSRPAARPLVAVEKHRVGGGRCHRFACRAFERIHLFVAFLPT